jgi:hypothetical protein
MKITITSPEFVGQYYDMNPETEDLLPNGYHLELGMVILIENPNYRADLVDIPAMTASGNARMDRINQFNRWGTVEHISFNGDEVFVAVRYVDDTKRLLRVATIDGWFVKKDSVPVKDVEDEKSEGWGGGELADASVGEDSVTFEQLGTGAKVTIPKNEVQNELKRAESFIKMVADKDDSRVLGTVTAVYNDEEDLKVEGVLNDEGMSYVQEDAELSARTQNDVDEDFIHEVNEDGPLARALKESRGALREERTTTTTETITEYYPPGVSSSRRYGRFDRRY